MSVFPNAPVILRLGYTRPNTSIASKKSAFHIAWNSGEARICGERVAAAFKEIGRIRSGAIDPNEQMSEAVSRIIFGVAPVRSVPL